MNLKRSVKTQVRSSQHEQKEDYEIIEEKINRCTKNI